MEGEGGCSLALPNATKGRHSGGAGAVISILFSADPCCDEAPHGFHVSAFPFAQA
jgi:hypothetical protein